jgi:hypothetical protein
MWRGARLYVPGSLVLAVLATLAGCGKNYFVGEREAWRHEAEVECLKSGAVKESVAQVRIDPIRGPGMCGADFPIKVEAFLVDRSAYGFADEVRPPAGIPGASQPRWPIAEPRAQAPSYPQSSYPSSQPAYQSPYPPTNYTPPPSASSSYPQPQYGAPSGSPQIQARPLPPVDNPYAGQQYGSGQYGSGQQPYSANPSYGSNQNSNQYVPRGAPRVGAPDISAPMSISSGGSAPRATAAPVERPYNNPPDAYPQTAYPQRSDSRSQPAAPPRGAPPQWTPAPQAAEEDEDDIPDDSIRPSQQQQRPPPRNATPPRATPVPLGTRPGMVTGSVGPVEVKPAATLACPIVSALDQWIANAVQPAAMKWLGAPVVEIKQISAYSCRGMNGQPGARISEHAFGNALDIAAFVLADGRKLTVKDAWYGLPEEQGFLRDVQSAACERFTTVLAPGSNRFHYDHIHVDLMRRASGHIACNPRAIPGEVAAERAKQRGSNWAKNGGDRSITGSIGGKKKDKKPFRFFGPYADEDEAEEDEGTTDQ